MGKPYAEEIAGLGGTLAWASVRSVESLRAALSASFGRPLVVVGSGGSLTVCQFMAMLHRRLAHQPARVCTPLGFLQEGTGTGEAAWLVSAGGANADILKAFSAAVFAEPIALGVLCGDRSSPLARLADACSYCDRAFFDLPSGKDGFLATNSLLAFCVLLMRAYEAMFSGQTDAIDTATLVRELLKPGEATVDEDFAQTKRVLERETLIVLHGAATHAAACDVESRFTEAGLGWVQVADYRNFAHGRHQWLAKNAEKSAVLAFIGPEERELAQKTLEILPKTVPTLALSLSGDWRYAALGAVLFSQRLAQWKGELCKVDPGRPGVPLFGHLIYELAYDEHEMLDVIGIDPDVRVAIERKTQLPVKRLAALGLLTDWVRDLYEYRSKLAQEKFAAVVFDYDGTLVSPAMRTQPPGHDIARELKRLLAAGAIVGIATGRGISVRDALRQVLPSQYWRQVHIGYYNGAEIADLANDTTPCRDGMIHKSLATVARELNSHRELSCVAKVTERPYQITIEPKVPISASALWTIVNDVVTMRGPSSLRVVQSSHSVDVLAPGIVKRTVVDAVWKNAGASFGEPICIGDRGRWPGNDFDLLSGMHSLSVDEVSGAADRCWNLAPPGVRGVEAAKEYLRKLRVHEAAGHLRFDIE